MRSRILLLPFFGILSSCSDNLASNFSYGVFSSTSYIVALEDDYSQNDSDGIFRDKQGSILYRGSEQLYQAALMNGSVRLSSGRVLTVDDTVNGQWRWAEVNNPFGRGAKCPMIPYRTLAVDPNVIPFYTVVFIERTKGLHLPDGSVHDGIWYATDSGGDIKGLRIDLFASAGIDSMNLLRPRGLTKADDIAVQKIGKLSDCP
jgi:hypothetical protein